MESKNCNIYLKQENHRCKNHLPLCVGLDKYVNLHSIKFYSGWWKGKKCLICFVRLWRIGAEWSCVVRWHFTRCRGWGSKIPEAFQPWNHCCNLWNVQISESRSQNNLKITRIIVQNQFSNFSIVRLNTRSFQQKASFLHKASEQRHHIFFKKLESEFLSGLHLLGLWTKVLAPHLHSEWVKVHVLCVVLIWQFNQWVLNSGWPFFAEVSYGNAHMPVVGEQWHSSLKPTSPNVAQSA